MTEPQHAPEDPTPAAVRRERTVALAWGCAEAALFFVVPDVWISWVALASTRRALVAAGCALVGALAGGALVYWLAPAHQADWLALYERLPGIGRTLIAHVAAALRDDGAMAVVAGGFTGSPYKLFAAQAATEGLALPAFLAASVVARGLRFALTAVVVGSILRPLALRFGAPPRALRPVLALLWIEFYAWYWYTMPG